ncbi:MAG: chorismate mutase [Firmicutes bacterium]|nr:chorismate mutase [Bacillota bacterium]
MKTTTKEKLNQMKYFGILLESKTEELNRICELRIGLMYASIEIRELVNEIIDDLNNEIMDMLNQRREIANAIGKVKLQRSRVVLEQRYFCNESVSKIAKKINYSKRQTNRHIESAVLEAEEYLQ